MRNYKKEYENYHSKPEQRQRRAGRVKARREMVKKYGKDRLRGVDVDHIDRNPNNNSPSNLRIQSRSANRSRNK